MVMEQPTILITGASGGIGKEVLRQFIELNGGKRVAVFLRDTTKNRRLKKQFPSVHVHFGDILNYEEVQNACHNKEVVIHLAAVIPTQLKNNSELFMHRVIVEGTQNVVRALEKVAPDAFLLYSSSVVVYGDRLQTPEIYTHDPLIPGQDPYAKAKIAAENIIWKSTIKWSIFRLSAIMGIGTHKLNKLMFHVPLETPMEITTVSDTAHAFVRAVDKKELLTNQIFDLGGGEACRLSYEGFLSRAFDVFGLGDVDFPPYTFAKQNFHCGYFMNGDQLHRILGFRRDTVASYFEAYRKAVPPAQRVLTRMVKKPVKRWLVTLSEPYKAHKKGDLEKIEYFFGPHYSSE